MSKRATLYRMVMPNHICPFGLKSKDLLERKGFEVNDHHLTSRSETDAFKEKHVNVIKSLISKNNINDVNAFNQAMSSFTNLDQNAAYVVEKIKQALS